MDEKLRQDLEIRLTMLRRNKLVSIWHDRKILPSNDWANEIDSNLNEADIILFLVSPEFLASDYCYDKEAKRAIERHNDGEAIVVPIILRPCEWHDSNFASIQALPKDAKAITLWENIDLAWNDTIAGLKNSINLLPSKSSITAPKPNSTNQFEVQPTFLGWLEDTEILLTHRKVDKVSLSDIYVPLDIETNESKESITRYVSSSKLNSEVGLYFVYGEEQQGKTTLLKHAYIEFLKNKFVPIYIDAKNITNSDISKKITSSLKEQYLSLDLDVYQELKNKVLLIDNFDRIALNQKFKNIFLKEITEIFSWVIITSHTSFNYVSSDLTSLSPYKESRLLGFGNVKREEIARKWVTLGVEELIEDSELVAKCDELKKQLDTVIKRNIVPPKPVYVLMLIQTFEAYSQQNLELTSYGHCYQQLIYQSFEKAKISPKEYEKYLNVLTELAWERYLRKEGFNNNQLEVFFKSYGTKYLSVNGAEIVEKLVTHSLLSNNGTLIDFKYPYIYYFFVGKKIAEGYSELPEISKQVDLLLENLHREDFANILIFITHHTKDTWVLAKIKEVLSSLFNEQDKATLAKDQLLFMDDFIKNIPNLVVEQREVQNVRDEHNRRLDEIERSRDDASDELESTDILSKINKTFKGMEIAGQIIRNRYATMTRESLFDLASSGTASGLRFLDYFIKISDEFKTEIIKFIESQLTEHPNLTNREIQTHAEDTYLQLTYGVINGVVRKTAAAVGSKEATEIYQALEESEKTPAYILINLAIDLQFTRTIQITSLDQAMKKLEGNPVCIRILKEIVIQHIYMFPVTYKIKQQLSELLEITVQGQRLMDSKKQLKA